MQTMQYYLIVIASVLSRVVSIDVCSYIPYTYCEDGYHCCDNDTQCCADVTLAVGAIIGIVVGSLFFIGCCIAVCCAVAKSSHRPGQVIQPAHQPGVTVIATGQQPGQPMYGQPMYGHPSYGQPQFGGQQAKGGSSSDPAYPPPPPPAY